MKLFFGIRQKMLKNFKNFNYSVLTRTKWQCYRCYSQEVAHEEAAPVEGKEEHIHFMIEKVIFIFF